MITEARNPRSIALDTMSAEEIVSLMNAEERGVLDALDAASGQLAVAASEVARVFQDGGRTFLLGAGTSGRLAVMEAAEIPPTFGVAPGRFVAFIAAGPSGGPAAITTLEDDMEAAPAALAAAGCGQADAVIGLAASGATPFVLAGLRYGLTTRAWTCGIANNSATPLLIEPRLGILLETGPEVLAGSTRLKAGTAAKLALNRISTTAMVLCGKVISNLMVDVIPSNQKLRDRCVRIVQELAGVDTEVARRLLITAAWNVRAALSIAGAPANRSISPRRTI
jgi:N-acetylmuramic acid 6-phosphate etherase